MLETLTDKYQIEKTLQKSAATAVYLVRHKQLDELRIIKCSPYCEKQSSEILSEACLLSKVNIDGIPKVLDIWKDDTYYYLCEEYIEGNNLTEYLLCQKRITREEIKNILLDVCNIIICLHSNKPAIIHRDIKPEHIILSKGKIYIIDLGSAVEIDQQEIYKNAGTLSFASPEAKAGKFLDERSDIYSIGKILEYMLQFAEEKDKSFEQICKKAISENIVERYTTVDQLISAIKGVETRSSNNTKGYLLEKIGIIGSERGVGCTHIAISTTVYLNKYVGKAIYVDRSQNRVVQKMYMCMPQLKLRNGILYHKNFCAWMNYGPGVEINNPPKGIQVVDIGVNDFDINEFDIMFYICSSTVWKQEITIKDFLKNKNVFIISNFADPLVAISQAKTLNKRVFGFKNSKPFCIDKSVKKMLQKIFKEVEGIEMDN